MTEQRRPNLAQEPAGRRERPGYTVVAAPTQLIQDFFQAAKGAGLHPTEVFSRLMRAYIDEQKKKNEGESTT